jgi:hypothetical protein
MYIPPNSHHSNMIMIICGGATSIALSQILFENVPRCLKFHVASWQQLVKTKMT